ncbi:MAG TPA: GDSL family lipase, partial [Blastocatellia bacterium]|nr:GDSL family lipase [Blastocatellia bacterium]
MITLAGMASAQRDGFYLKDGDRVVFYGDSITEQRLYTAYIQQYVYLRYP